MIKKFARWLFMRTHTDELDDIEMMYRSNLVASNTDIKHRKAIRNAKSDAINDTIRRLTLNDHRYGPPYH